jgi:hypothetical protein
MKPRVTHDGAETEVIDIYLIWCVYLFVDYLTTLSVSQNISCRIFNDIK